MLSAKIGDIIGFYVVTTVVAALGVWVVTKLRRGSLTPTQSALYAVNYSIARIVWRTRVEGCLPVAPNEGAVIVCNHRCPLDPSFLAITTRRVIHWMVAREYCEQPAFRRILRTCEVIPVRRGVMDMAAMRTAIRLVRQGELVGLFPEGRINTTSQLLLPGRPGAAMIALKARATVVPCYIEGAPYDGTTLGCLLMPAAVRLVIGRRLDLAPYFDRDLSRETFDLLTERFLEEIARLAGRPDFQPQVVRSRLQQEDDNCQITESVQFSPP